MVMRGMLIAGMALLCCGCLSPQERAWVEAERDNAIAEAKALQAELVNLKGQLADALEKVKAGEIPTAEGAAIIASYNEVRARLDAAIDENRRRMDRLNEIAAQGDWTDWLDILVTVLGGGGLGAAATRALRGPSSRKYKTPDGRINVE